MTGELSFFEFGTGDYGKAEAFYSKLFGWTFAETNGGGTIETPNVPGGIHTGDAGGGPYVFFAVDDIGAATARVEELGGSAKSLDDSPENIEKFGRFALCEDDQGSAFGLHQKPG